MTRASAFLMTPAQHRRQAELLRDAGREDLAQQHELLAKVIARRGGTESPAGPQR